MPAAAPCARPQDLASALALVMRRMGRAAAGDWAGAAVAEGGSCVFHLEISFVFCFNFELLKILEIEKRMFVVITTEPNRLTGFTLFVWYWYLGWLSVTRLLQQWQLELKVRT